MRIASEKEIGHISLLKRSFSLLAVIIGVGFLFSFLLVNYFAVMSWKWQIAIFLPSLLIIFASLSENPWEGLFVWSIVALIPLDLQVSIWSSEIHGTRGLSIHLLHVGLWINLLILVFVSGKKVTSIAKKERAQILSPLIFLFGLGIISTFWSYNPKLTISQSFIEINGLIIFLVVFYWAFTSGNIKKYLDAFLAISAFEIILALAQGIGITSFGLYGFARDTFVDTLFLPGIGEIRRPSGTLMGGPTTFAVFLLIVISICILLKKCSSNIKESFLYNFNIMGGSICIFLTYTRVVWILLVLVLVSITILEKTLRKYCLFLLILILAASLFMMPYISSRLIYSAKDGLKVRKDMYQVASNMIADHPILGVGLNNYAALRSVYDTGPYYVTQELPESLVHNNFLLYFAELGVLGILALIWFYFASFRLGWRCQKLSKDDFGNLFGKAFIICMFGIFVAGLFQPGPLRSSTGIFYTLLFLAALCCAQCAIECSMKKNT